MIKGSKVLIMGLTYTENAADMRGDGVESGQVVMRHVG